MIALLCFVWSVLISLFKSEIRLEAENVVLRHQVMVLRRQVRGRVHVTNFDRLLLVQLYRWCPSILRVLAILQPETVVRWHRAGFRCYWRWKSRRRGRRPQIDAELRALIRRMSLENVLWGAPRIQGELLKLGFTVAQSIVAKFMAKYMAKRDNPSGQRWGMFLRNHAPQIAAMDLLVVPTVGFIQLYVLVIVRLGRRELAWINVTRHPTAEWIAQQTTEAFPWNQAPRYLVRDQDGIYGAAVTRRLRAMGIRDRPIAPGCPWQNGCAERLIGTIRRVMCRPSDRVWRGSSAPDPSRVCRVLQWLADPSLSEPGYPPSLAWFRPSAPSHHDLFSAAFITDTAESRFLMLWTAPPPGT